ncbi:hypothetical protein RJ641_023521, partial [Dillenia turbinata]
MIEEDNFISNEVVCNDEDEVKRNVKFLNQQLPQGVICSKESSLSKRLVIEYGYHWLRRFMRQPDEIFLVPYLWLLKVGTIPLFQLQGNKMKRIHSNVGSLRLDK